MTKTRSEYRFYHQETGKVETVMPETWQWEAYFQDGHILKQFDDQGIFHQIRQIEQKKLAVFKMVSVHFPQTYSIVFDPLTMKLLHFYRNIVLNATTESEERIRLYCFGYEKKVGSKVIKTILVITPEDKLYITDNIDQLSWQIGS